MAVDYYEILGVEKSATQEEIKKAFRRKARELHPDVNGADDAEERFKELNTAYDTLSDPQRRDHYDRFGTSNGNGGFGGGYTYADMGDIFGGMGGMGDIFSAFFGGAAGRRSAASREGRDMNVAFSITLEEAATGVEKEIVYDRLAPCDECEGSGSADGSTSVTCPDCSGTGRVMSVQRTMFGNMQTQAPCPRCQATGHVIENPCTECDGQGRVPDREHVTIQVPKGVRDSQILKVTGYGEAGMHNAPAGDLLAHVHIEPHDDFVREGDTLHTSVEVPMVQAALGAELEIEGILGDITVSVPAGSQHGDKIRVKHEGMPKFGSDDRGDLYVHVGVSVPKKLSKHQRELLEQLAEDMGTSVSARRGWFNR